MIKSVILDIPSAMSSRFRKAVALFSAGLAILLLCPPSFSQVNSGRILGQITDQTGGLIAGASVTIVDVARGASRPLTTDSAGEFNAPNLIPGTYTVRAEAKGFKATERPNVLVDVGQEVRIDLSLQPGEQNLTITVTEALPMINTTNASLGGTVEQQEINDLPINGRNFQNMFDFRPEIIRKPGNGPIGASTNGLQSMWNTYMLEGLFNKNVYGATYVVGGSNDLGDAATTLSVDSIQATTMVTNAKAEYGWGAGAVVNVGIKSGTNKIHGTAFAIGRDSAFDARNPFLSPATGRAPLEEELFGATIGGPILKDKLFLFASYEGRRLTTSQSGTANLPTLASLPTSGTSCSFTHTGDCTNSFVNAISDMIAGSHTPNQLSLNLAGCVTVPAVSCQPTALFTNTSNSTSLTGFTPNSTNNNNAIGKLDYHINDRHSFSAEFLHGRNYTIESTGFDPYNFWDRLNPIYSDVFRASEIWTPSSNWVNEARFGWHRENKLIKIGECSQNLGSPNYASLGFVAGTQFPCAFPGVTIGTFTTTLGCACDPEPRQDSTFQVADAISHTVGKHQLKFGGEWRHTNFLGGLNKNGAGVITFGGGAGNAFTNATPLEDFLAGYADTAAVLAGDPKRHTIQYFYAGFIQDDWRAASKLTVNAGLRYEFSTPVRETSNLFGGFDPSSPTGVIQPGVTAGEPSTMYAAYYKGFAPRLGLAYDLSGKGTTVIRAGGGLFYVFQNYTQHMGSITEQLDLTGGTLFNGDNSVRPNPVPSGAVGIAAGSPNFTATGTAGTPAVPWAVNVPVFNVTGVSGLVCGNSQRAVSPLGVTLTPTNPAPCNIGSIDPKITPAYVTEWNLSVDHAFTSNLSLDVSYVGNHGGELWGTVDLNQPTAGPSSGSALRRPFTQNCLAPGAAGANSTNSATGGLGLNPSQCFPYIAQILFLKNLNQSNYNGLQMTLTQRMSHGVSFTGNYVFAHSLANDSIGNGSASNWPQDSTNPRADYGNSSFDLRNRASFTASWAIPGRRAPGQMLEGWQVNSIVILDGRIPFEIQDSTDNTSGTGEKRDRWNLAGPASDFTLGGVATVPCFGLSGSKFAKAPCITVTALPAQCIAAATATGGANGVAQLNAIGCYMEGGAVLVPPAQGTFGTMARNALRGPGMREWDLSLEKNWKFRDRLTAQFRSEFFNVLNSVEYSAPRANPGSPSTFGTSASVAGATSPTNGTGNPRGVQLGLKLIF